MLKIGIPWRLLLSATACTALYFSLPDMARAQKAEAYSRDAMTQALATRHRYNLYGIRFESDKAVIQKDAAALLDDIATAMKNFPDWRLRITGHTDASGGAAHNEVLSLARANAVKQALLDRGITAARLETLGMGQFQPVAPNDTPESRALNRRVELVRLDATSASEKQAKGLLKAMSDYLAAQKTLSYGFDSNYEVVSQDGYKISLMSSGTIEMSRPDKVRVTRTGGFANIEVTFDGKTLTLLGKNANLYAQVDVPGTVDNLVDQLREKFNRPISGADLILSNVYEFLLSEEVVEAKDLGSGVIGGVECDHLAFRTKDVDWQIWIAHGARPYPCRYVITSRNVDQAPQFGIQIRDWKTGAEVTAPNFSFTNASNAKRIDLKELAESGDLPSHFTVGGAQ